jgi:hypothetical protein
MKETNTAQAAASSPRAAKCHLRALVFILGCHKSGTSLVRALLDGHDEVVVFRLCSSRRESTLA